MSAFVEIRARRDSGPPDRFFIRLAPVADSKSTFGSVQLPFILPHDAMLHAILRRTHTILAYLFFLAFLGHFSAVLFHKLIVKDGLLMRMAPWNAQAEKRVSGNE
jgi:cytochrome b561